MSLRALLNGIPATGSLATIWSLCANWLSVQVLARSSCPC